MNNRDRFQQLLENNGIPQVKSAELIRAVTSRPCSERAVRSWPNDPTSKHSRKCPDWAVDALENAIRYMARLVEQRRNAA